MNTVNQWTGVETTALREALRQTQEKFAETLKMSLGGVKKWERLKSASVLSAYYAAKLDRLLEETQRVNPGAAARFWSTVHTTPTTVEGDALLQSGVSAELAAADDDQVLVSVRTLTGEVVLVSLPRRAVVLGMGAGMLAAATGASNVRAIANSRIDHVQHFRELRLSLIESDNLFGSGRVLPLMEDNVRVMRELRRGGIGDSAGLLRMQILYAEGCAWLHQDGRRFDEAQYWGDRAVEWSLSSGDNYFLALSLIRKAQLADDMGNGLDAVELAEAAERAAPAGTRFPTAAAVYAGLGYAMSGQRSNSERAFDRARTIVTDAEFDSTWGFFLDMSYIDVHQALGRMTLGDHRASTNQYAAAIARMQSGYPRDHGVYLARKALAHNAAGEIEPAAADGLEALRIGVETGSARIIHEVNQLAAAIDITSKQPGVGEFRAALETWKEHA
ncbi:hypothetical protein [Nocardia brasiliensis]|uniref:hypothetical protein n=1 Tax=Nocardia brasiliensis TaxID=37326 RepID=UPI00366D98ED